MVGEATRTGLPPSFKLLSIDLVAGCSDGEGNFIDSLTNSGESGVHWSDMLEQRHRYLEGKMLGLGEGKSLSVLDVPASEKGLGQCGWEYPHYEKPTSHLHRLSTTWTPPSSITWPHWDGLGCALHHIHWHGEKLWLLWPATASNMEACTKSRIAPTFDVSFNLITKLEGLELVHLLPNQPEVVFDLYPNTIHCCMSITQSMHSGTVVGAAEDIPRLNSLFSFQVRWIKGYVANSAVCKSVKKSAVLNFIEDIDK